jgi:CBS domain-containing protein
LIPPQGKGHFWKIFSATDFLMVLGQNVSLDTITVEEFASIAKHVARPDWTYDRAVAEMVNHGVNHLPVIDTEGKLVGLLSARDAIENY